MELSKEKLQKNTAKIEITNDVQAYLSGDETAFERMHGYLESVIHSILYSKRYSFNENIIDDLKQECWLEIICKLHRWEPERGSLRTFLTKCLTNRIASYFRSTDSDQKYFPVENIETYITHETEDIPDIDQELTIRVHTRLTGALAMYVLRRISIAVYYRVFEHHRTRIIKELCDMSGRPPKEILFLVDYSLVVLRRHHQEISWQKKMQTSVSNT
nr:hypothetical protein 12 [bacterium]